MVCLNQQVQLWMLAQNGTHPCPKMRCIIDNGDLPHRAKGRFQHLPQNALMVCCTKPTLPIAAAFLLWFSRSGVNILLRGHWIGPKIGNLRGSMEKDLSYLEQCFASADRFGFRAFRPKQIRRKSLRPNVQFAGEPLLVVRPTYHGPNDPVPCAEQINTKYRAQPCPCRPLARFMTSIIGRLRAKVDFENLVSHLAPTACRWCKNARRQFGSRGPPFAKRQ